MATKSALKYSGTQIQGHGIVPGYQLARFRPHRHRVLNLYKKAMRLVQKDMVDTRDNIRRTSDHDFRFEAVLLRSQFDANKHVTSLAKATQLLKDGEELYFINQGFYTFEHAHLPWSEFGIAYQRFEATSHEVKLRNEWWGANEWARYPDIYDNYKKWIALRNETWSEEMNTLEEADAKTIQAGERLTEDFPAAKAADGPPPFWWRYVTRPLQHPAATDYDFYALWARN